MTTGPNSLRQELLEGPGARVTVTHQIPTSAKRARRFTRQRHTHHRAPQTGGREISASGLLEAPHPWSTEVRDPPGGG